jgi:glycosyltransferase involved in cell wall biosynthesis
MPRDALRIALLSERADFFGGGQRSLLDMARILRASRYQPIAILPGPGALAEALTAEEVPIRYLDLPPVSRRSFPRPLQTVWALAHLIRRERIALLHSDAPRTALYAGLSARLLRRRHVWHLRASIPSSALSDRLLLELSDRVVAVSQAASGRSRAMARSTRVQVVRTGLRPPAFLTRSAARDALGLPAEGLVAGVVGRVERDKGAECAIDALPALRAAAPEARLMFLGAHGATRGFALALEDRARRLGVREAIDFPGDRPDAARLLPAFDLLLHPALHEALPRVLIEALYAGVPVVASRVGGIPEVIEDGVTGLLAPPRDAAALAAHAVTLARDAGMRRAIAAAGPPIAAQRFSLEAMGVAILSLYDTLLASPGEEISCEAFR